MSRNSLRSTICFLVMIAQVGGLFTAPLAIVDFSEALDVILIMVPLAGASMTVIVAHYASDKVKRKVEAPYPPTAAVLSIMLAIAFGAALFGAELLFYLGTIPDIDTLKRTLSVIDTALGVYVAMFVKNLFA